MTTHYSILSVQIRPEIQEKISIGFILTGNKKIFFNYSKNKLSVAKNLLNESVYRLLKDSLKNIENTAIKENNNSDKDNLLLINEPIVKNSFSTEYLNYLSRYNNNVLSFSTPKAIDLEANEYIFQQLFRKYVDDSDLLIDAMVKVNYIEVFRQKNREQLQTHFNFEKEFTPKEMINLIAPVKIDLFGQNEIPVYAQFIDLDRRLYDIDNDLAQVLLLDLAFTQQKQPNKAFVVSKEPDKKEIKQHEIWTQLRLSKKFDYVEIKDGDKILEYARQHDVHPISIDNDEPEIDSIF